MNAPAKSVEMPSDTAVDSLARIERLVGTLPGPAQGALRDELADLRRTLEARARDHATLARSQAEALVNSAMMMSELKRTQAALEQARARAEQANQDKSGFLATISHEIRTPLNGILGMLEVLFNSSLDPRQARSLKVLRGSAESMLALVNDVLDLARIEAGRLELAPHRFDLAGLLDDVARLYDGMARAKGLDLVLAVPPDLPDEVEGDSARLRQVLNNLVSNAIKFTSHGAVVLRVAAVGKQRWRFEVEDSGIGIENAVRERIFEAFTQADASTARTYGGTGLGLAIAAELVTLLGGEIGVDSTPGAGSRFWFTVPLQTLATAPAAAGESLAGLRVLLLEHHAEARAVLAANLVAWGCQPVCAEDAERAREAWRAAASPFDAVVVDPAAVGADGLDFLCELTASDGAAGPMRILTCAVDHEPPAATLAAAGAVCLSRPVLPRDLRQALAAPPPADATRPTASPRNDAGRRILVVEDNLVNQEITREFLRVIGHEAVLTADGEAALQVLAEQRFDLVLMDCRMPRMDGLTATSRWREIEAGRGGPRTPVIALTANALATDREQCLAAGMDDFMTKPFALADLEAMLARWLAAPQGAPAAGAVQHTRNDGGATAAPSHVDPSALARFTGRRHDDDVLDRLLRGFLDQSASQVHEVHTGIAARDLERAGFAAHGLKSSSAVVGAAALADLAARLEEATRQRDTVAADGLAGPLATEHTAVCAELRARYLHITED
ncbi:MAG: response regulator [Gammaproteobacteria bacterium]|nr:response regulator [Gammaproteobacteria bacterium]